VENSWLKGVCGDGVRNKDFGGQPIYGGQGPPYVSMLRRGLHFSKQLDTNKYFSYFFFHNYNNILYEHK